MSKRVYISADYASDSGDRDVVETLNKWGTDSLHKVDFVDMAQVVSGSVVNSMDECYPCDLKAEFNRQINASSVVICVIGDKTATRTAGSLCSRFGKNYSFGCTCTPYKQSRNGIRNCKVDMTYPAMGEIGNINNYSYLRHEFEQAKIKNKTIIVVYNSLIREPKWLPHYMKEYESRAEPFWKKDDYGRKVGNYTRIKEALGYV